MQNEFYPNGRDTSRESATERARTSFRGLGPHTYVRSNAWIEDDINESLANDPYIDASHIHATVTDSSVLLEGRVQEAYAKQHAERIVMLVRGVRHVENNLRVMDEEDSASEAEQPEHPTIISEANAAARNE